MNEPLDAPLPPSSPLPLPPLSRLSVALTAFLVVWIFPLRWLYESWALPYYVGLVAGMGGVLFFLWKEKDKNIELGEKGSLRNIFLLAFGVYISLSQLESEGFSAYRPYETNWLGSLYSFGIPLSYGEPGSFFVVSIVFILASQHRPSLPRHLLWKGLARLGGLYGVLWLTLHSIHFLITPEWVIAEELILTVVLATVLGEGAIFWRLHEDWVALPRDERSNTLLLWASAGALFLSFSLWIWVDWDQKTVPQTFAFLERTTAYWIKASDFLRGSSWLLLVFVILKSQFQQPAR